MRASLFRFLTLLARIGIGRVANHVDAAERLHLVVAAKDATSGLGVADVEVLLEKPPEGVETGPSLRALGKTNPAGGFDETVRVGWSYDVEPSIGSQPPPRMTIILRKTPYRETRHPFDLTTLPRISVGRELNLQTIQLAH